MVRHRIDGLETYHKRHSVHLPVRHRIDGLEMNVNFSELELYVRHRIDGLERTPARHDCAG